MKKSKEEEEEELTYPKEKKSTIKTLIPSILLTLGYL